MASKARWLTANRFEFLIAIAGIAFLLVGVLLLPKPHGVSEHPLVLDLALEIDSQQEFDKCPRVPPEVNPQIYFSQKDEHELVAFLDIYGLFGGESERLTDSLAKYAGGRDPDRNSTLRVPRSTLQRIDRYNFNSLNCMHYEFIVEPNQDHNNTKQTNIDIQPVSVFTAVRTNDQVSFQTNSLTQHDELFRYRSQQAPRGGLFVAKSLFREHSTNFWSRSTEEALWQAPDILDT